MDNRSNDFFSSNKFCFFESQGWQGSNPIEWDSRACDNEDPADNPPECDDPTFSTRDISDEMKSLSNLYPRDLVSDSPLFGMNYSNPDQRHSIAATVS